MKSKKRKWMVVILCAACIALVSWFLLSAERVESKIVLSTDQIEQIPPGEVHWHPRLTILIDGEQIHIPTGIGIAVGNRVDTRLSGMRMSPTHTHESDGTLHLENRNPRSKPETLTIGYFFYVWDKTFNSTCIFDYCTDSGTLRMTVNGTGNTQFETYLMKDHDDIRIEYFSDKNK